MKFDTALYFDVEHCTAERLVIQLENTHTQRTSSEGRTLMYPAIVLQFMSRTLMRSAVVLQFMRRLHVREGSVVNVY